MFGNARSHRFDSRRILILSGTSHSNQEVRMRNDGERCLRWLERPALS